MKYPATDNSIGIALEILDSGAVIVCPTDTIYGFSCDATNPDAILKVNQLKQRSQPSSIIVSDVSEISKFGLLTDDIKSEFMNILPGPYTVLIEKIPNSLPNSLTLDSPLIGIRIPDLSFAQILVKKFGKPITTTSVNRHGHPACLTVSEITESFPDIPIFEKNENTSNKGSTIINFSLTPPQVIRQGIKKYPS